MEDLQYWKVSKKITKRILIGLFILLFLYALIRPMYCDFTDRAKMSEILISFTPAKTVIKEAYKNNHPLGAVDFKPYYSNNPNISYQNISSEGVITIYSAPLKTLAVLTPNIINGSLQWQCFGSPQVNVAAFACNQ